MSRKQDPMLLPMRDPKMRETELRLLREYEIAGKIRRIDYLAPVELTDEDDAEEQTELRQVNNGKLSLGDGNYQIGKRRTE